MIIEIDETIDTDFVYEVEIQLFCNSDKKPIYRTTINLHQKDVSIQRAIKYLKLEKTEIKKVIITAVQQLSEVNFKK